MRISLRSEKDLLLQDYIQDLWACARIEVKDPLESGLPVSKAFQMLEIQQPM